MEKIRCTRGHVYGSLKTREECKGCKWCNLGDCVQGAYFVHRYDERDKYEDYLVNA
jgi:hypothetical protein